MVLNKNLRFLNFVNMTAKPKIAQLNIQILIQQQVLRLDIPMHDPVIMQINQPKTTLVKKLLDGLGREGVVPNQIAEHGPALSQIQDYDYRLALFEPVVKLDNVLVV